MCIIYNKIIHVCSHHQKVFFENENYKIRHYFCHPRFYSVHLSKSKISQLVLLEMSESKEESSVAVKIEETKKEQEVCYLFGVLY